MAGQNAKKQGKMSLRIREYLNPIGKKVKNCPICCITFWFRIKDGFFVPLTIFEKKVNLGYMKIKSILPFLLLTLTLGACNTTENREKPEEFIVDLDSRQIQAGEIEAQLETFMALGPFKKQNITVIYFPREDAVCLQFRLNYYTYSQFWSSSGRGAFITALEEYKEDYAERRLAANVRRSNRKYGIVQGYLVWQMSFISARLKGNMDVELGYTFKDRSPYFSVFQREAFYEDPLSEADNKNSSQLTMYFTRAQAEELAALFDPAFLRELAVPGGIFTSPDVDEY